MERYAIMVNQSGLPCYLVGTIKITSTKEVVYSIVSCGKHNAKLFESKEDAEACIDSLHDSVDCFIVHATRLCAWCGKVETWGDLAEPVSHSMCEECLAKEREEMRKEQK